MIIRKKFKYKKNLKIFIRNNNNKKKFQNQRFNKMLNQNFNKMNICKKAVT